MAALCAKLTYGVQVSDVVLLHHLPGVARVADILEGLGRDLAGVLDQDLLAARMLKELYMSRLYNGTFHHFMQVTWLEQQLPYYIARIAR